MSRTRDVFNHVGKGLDGERTPSAGPCAECE